jgi:hypothetical protein
MNDVNQRLMAACKELLSYAQRTRCPPATTTANSKPCAAGQAPALRPLSRRKRGARPSLETFQLAAHRIVEVIRRRRAA